MPQSTAQTTRRTRTVAVLRHLDFGDLRHVAAESVWMDDAAAAPWRQRLSPAGLFGGERQDRLGARRLVEQSEPVGDRSCFAAAASSSMKLSVTKTLCEGPTLRQNAVGMPGGSTRTYST